jgi:hypothetical protein
MVRCAKKKSHLVFLWLQEKSLFGMGAILFNPTPGVKFHACDLIRNLLLSNVTRNAVLSVDNLDDRNHVSEKQQQQQEHEHEHEEEVLSSVIPILSLSHEEAKYRTEWLEPLELALQGADNLDACISCFLDQNKYHQLAKPFLTHYPTIGKCERALGELEDSEFGSYVSPNKTRTSGIGLYARFVTAAEELEIILRNDGLSVEPELVGKIGVTTPDTSCCLSAHKVPEVQVIHQFEQFGHYHEAAAYGEETVTAGAEDSQPITCSLTATDGDSRSSETSESTTSHDVSSQEETILISPITCTTLLKDLRTFAVGWSDRLHHGRNMIYIYIYIYLH